MFSKQAGSKGMAMPEKETSQNTAEAAIDLRTLELELDKQIDALLVPAIQRAKRTSDGSQTAGKPPASSQPKSGRDNREPAVTSNLSLDFDDLQFEIEKEIDNLFIPAEQWHSRGPAKTGQEKLSKKAKETSQAPDGEEIAAAPQQAGPSPETFQAADATGAKLDELQFEIETEIDNLFVPAEQFQSRRPAKTGQEKLSKKAKKTSHAPDGEEIQAAPQQAGPSPETFQAADATGAKLDELQFEIETEIDNLFVPAEQFQSTGPAKTGQEKLSKKAKETSHAPDGKEIQAAPQQAGPSPGTFQAADATGAKLDELQFEIETEIDNLFVPAEQFQSTGPAKTGQEKLSKKAKKTSHAPDGEEIQVAPQQAGPSPETFQAADATGGKLDELQFEIETEIDNLFVPADELQTPASVQSGTEKLSKKAKATSYAPDGGEIAAAPQQAGPSPETFQAADANGAKLDELEFEIETEIDNLFVPADELQIPAPPKTGNKNPPKKAKGASYAPDGEEIQAVAGQDGLSPEPFQAVDATGGKLDDLEFEIETEIDSLFVPADRSQTLAPVQSGDENLSAKARDISYAPDGEEIAAAPEKAVSSPGAFQAEESGNNHDESSFDNVLSGHPTNGSELDGMIEKFNAAYLSLDWELSSENIRKFLAATSRLEPFAARSSDTKSVLRMMQVILTRLRDRPHAVNSMLVQLIRDSQGLLAHMLLIGGESGPREKERLKDLFARFNDLRQRALAAKAGATKHKPEVIALKAEAPASGDVVSPVRETPPALFSSVVGTGSLHELLDWTDKTRHSLSENLNALDAEIVHIRQIETVLNKTPNLATLAARLNGVGNAIEGQIDILRNKRGELIEWASRIASLETAYANVRIQAQKPEGDAPAAETVASCGKDGVSVSTESICLIESDGKCLALPVGCVLRVARSSAKKGAKILKRGYATLGDFRPPLRGIRTRVLGEWAKRPSKELNSYRFEPVEPAAFEHSGKVGRTAVLASDGQRHVVIFAESADLMADAKIAASVTHTGDIGASEIQSTYFTLAFDPGNPLPLPDQISSTNSSADGCCRR
jgi:hypothetical protein